jgi:hypothetical protein
VNYDVQDVRLISLRGELRCPRCPAYQPAW